MTTIQPGAYAPQPTKNEKAAMWDDITAELGPGGRVVGYTEAGWAQHMAIKEKAARFDHMMNQIHVAEAMYQGDLSTFTIQRRDGRHQDPTEASHELARIERKGWIGTLAAISQTLVEARASTRSFQELVLALADIHRGAPVHRVSKSYDIQLQVATRVMIRRLREIEPQLAKGAAIQWAKDFLNRHHSGKARTVGGIRRWVELAGDGPSLQGVDDTFASDPELSRATTRKNVEAVFLRYINWLDNYAGD